MAAPPLRPLSTGEVLDVSFGLYRSIFPSLFVVTVVTWGLPAILGMFFAEPGAIFRHPVLYLFTVIFSVACGALGLAGVTFIISNAYIGQTLSPAEALRRSVPLIWRLFLITLMMILVSSFAFAFFIIPGLWVLSGLCLSTVVAVIEGPPKANQALDRSWALTKGFRMKAFLVILVPGLLVYVVPMMSLAMLTLLAGVKDPIILTVLVGVLRVFFYPFLYVVLAVLYYDLRVRKEGFDLEVLATELQPA